MLAPLELPRPEDPVTRIRDLGALFDKSPKDAREALKHLLDDGIQLHPLDDGRYRARWTVRGSTLFLAGTTKPPARLGLVIPVLIPSFDPDSRLAAASSSLRCFGASPAAPAMRATPPSRSRRERPNALDAAPARCAAAEPWTLGTGGVCVPAR